MSWSVIFHIRLFHKYSLHTLFASRKYPCVQKPAKHRLTFIFNTPKPENQPPTTSNKPTQPKMPRGTRLSLVERGKILSFKEEGVIPAEIARRLNRPDKVVANFLRDPATYETKKSSVRPSKVSPRDKRGIKMENCKKPQSCPSVKRNLDLQDFRQPIWREVKKRETSKASPGPPSHRHA